jgi:ABC-type Fe2+-enterobactin transport system substrate-binding protein
MKTTADGTHDLTGGNPFGDGQEVDAEQRIAELEARLAALEKAVRDVLDVSPIKITESGDIVDALRQWGQVATCLNDSAPKLEAQLATMSAALEPFANYATSLKMAQAPKTAAVRYDPLFLLSDKEPSVGDFLTAADVLADLPAARAKGEPEVRS